MQLPASQTPSQLLLRPYTVHVDRELFSTWVLGTSARAVRTMLMERVQPKPAIVQVLPADLPPMYGQRTVIGGQVLYYLGPDPTSIHRALFTEPSSTKVEHIPWSNVTYGPLRIAGYYAAHRVPADYNGPFAKEFRAYLLRLLAQGASLHLSFGPPATPQSIVRAVLSMDWQQRYGHTYATNWLDVRPSGWPLLRELWLRYVWCPLRKRLYRNPYND